MGKASETADEYQMEICFTADAKDGHVRSTNVAGPHGGSRVRYRKEIKNSCREFQGGNP